MQTEPKKVDERRLRAAINNADTLSCGACDRIEQLGIVALDLLDFDAWKLERAHTLISIMISEAQALSNAINYEAEQVGESFVDQADRARKSAWWAKHHAFRRGVQP